MVLLFEKYDGSIKWGEYGDAAFGRFWGLASGGVG